MFADLDLATARERALAEGKLLLVDATAVWCGPCRMMDRTTWADPAVASWIRQHAVAMRFDVDARRDLARELRIEADVQARLDLAGELARARRYDEATIEYAWLWEHTLGDDPVSLVRMSGLAHELRLLVTAHPLARNSFAIELRPRT